MKTFSEFAVEIMDEETIKFAEKMGKDFSDELNRRLKEIEDGTAWCLYRPWDDKVAE